jgi:hypothetical protein
MKMKKLLLVLSLVMVMVLGACVPSTEPYDDSDLQVKVNTLNVKVNSLENELDTVQDELEALRQQFSNLVYTDGLNGQRDYYINKDGGGVMLSLMDYTQLASTEKDYLDKTKFPDYIWGLDEEYVSVEELGDLLCDKYLGIDCTSITGFQYKIKAFKPEGMNDTEYMVRLSMMMVELAEYDFYTIDSSELYIEFIEGSSKYIKTRMSLLVTDKYNLHPALFWNSLMDTQIVGMSVNDEACMTIYQDYVTNETFSGYVLPNYSK